MIDHLIADGFSIASIAALAWWVGHNRIPATPIAERKCENCKHFSPDTSLSGLDNNAAVRFGKCERGSGTLPFASVERKFKHLCGPNGRRFKPKEQDDGGHRTTVEAAPSGADQATNQSAGAAAASAGATTSPHSAGAGVMPFGFGVAASALGSGLTNAQQGITLGATGALYSIPGGFVYTDARSQPKIEEAGITVGEIVAWRAWRVFQGFLLSVYADKAWSPDEPMDGDVDKGYGVHAWRSSHDALHYGMNNVPGMVVGRVALWGTVVEHERGYRAQYAKPLSFDYIVGGGDPKAHDMILAMLRTQYKTETL